MNLLYIQIETEVTEVVWHEHDFFQTKSCAIETQLTQSRK